MGMGGNGIWIDGNGREWECWKPFPHISTMDWRWAAACVQCAGRGGAYCVAMHTACFIVDMLQILSYFHKHKKQTGVDDMLLKLYEPILWRSLKVGGILVIQRPRHCPEIPQITFRWPPSWILEGINLSCTRSGVLPSYAASSSASTS